MAILLIVIMAIPKIPIINKYKQLYKINNIYDYKRNKQYKEYINNKQ